MGNRIKYSEDELLPLSGIQHFAFCERQWSLIHIESQWVENQLTAEGRILHQKVDDPYFVETRREVKMIRAVPLLSTLLGLFGVADLIEIYINTSDDNPQYDIVEYKRGKPKPDDCDMVQLCAQAICLEEMLGLNLSNGHLFYHQTRRRIEVSFDYQLRNRVKELSGKMHDYFETGYTPPPIKKTKCRGCSLKDICLPKLQDSSSRLTEYFKSMFEE